jgi:hypothetical protein
MVVFILKIKAKLDIFHQINEIYLYKRITTSFYNIMLQFMPFNDS